MDTARFDETDFDESVFDGGVDDAVYGAGFTQTAELAGLWGKHEVSQ